MVGTLSNSAKIIVELIILSLNLLLKYGNDLEITIPDRPVVGNSDDLTLIINLAAQRDSRKSGQGRSWPISQTRS